MKLNQSLLLYFLLFFLGNTSLNAQEDDNVAILNEMICEGDIFFFGKQYYREAGTYTDTLKTSLGTDSIVTLNLTVKTIPALTIAEETVCQNSSIHLNFTGDAPFELDYTFNGVRQRVTVSEMETVLTATQAGENQFIIHELTSGNGCSSSDIFGKGVDINGVIWATRNVDKPGTFTATPEDAGWFYQWGKKVGWNTTDPRINTDGDSNWDWSFPSNTGEWEAENDPCPCGWRVPTTEEQRDMIMEGSVDTIQNGRLGRLSRTDRNTIFLPYALNSDGLIAGWRNIDGSLQVFETGDYSYGPHHSDYWSSTSQTNTVLAFGLCFRIGNPPLLEPVDMRFCPLVRCVKDISRCPQITVITVNTVVFDTVKAVICSNDNFLFDGKEYNQTGIYTDTLKTVFGCDSIATLDLTVNPAYTNEPVQRFICEGDSIFFGRQYYNRTGIYVDTFKTVLGCDSIATLNLTVNPVYTDAPVQRFICEGEPFFFAGKYYNQTGIYIDTLKTIAGCDSIVKLDLIVNKTWNESESDVICVSQLPYTWRDITFPEGTKSGTFVFNRNSISGCDSIVTLDLTVMSTSEITLDSDKQTVCQDGTQEITLTAKVKFGNPTAIVWFDGEETAIDANGTCLKTQIPRDLFTEYWAYAVDAACGNSPRAYTSVSVTNKVYLLLNSDKEKIQIGDEVTLTVTPSNNEHETYHWYDASGKFLGETVENQFTVTLDAAGNYAFYVVTGNGYCPESTSGEVYVQVADLAFIPNIITPYNENGMNDTFMTPKDSKPGYRVEIYNIYQQKIYEGENGWNGMYRGELAYPGTYYFRLFMKDGTIEVGSLEVAKF